MLSIPDPPFERLLIENTTIISSNSRLTHNYNFTDFFFFCIIKSTLRGIFLIERYNKSSCILRYFFLLEIKNVER